MKTTLVKSFSILLLSIFSWGCATPPHVAEKIHQEAIIHQGYLRLAPRLSREDLIRIVEADAKAWVTLDIIVNDGVAPVISSQD